MGHPQSWQEHFKKSLGGLSESSSLTEAMTQGCFTEVDYLTWACENYQHPVLDHLFFSSPKAPKKETWLKWKGALTWSTTCLPLGEWDGHLIIGCLEPVEIPAELSAIYVFSPAAPLQELWNQWSSISAISAVNSEPLLEGFELKDSSEITNSGLSERSSDQSEIGESESNLESESVMPEGLSPSLAPQASFLSRVPLTPLSQNEPPEFPDSQITSAPNSVNLVALAPATPNTESSQVVDFETVAVETVASKSEQEETGASEIVASETMPTQKIAHPKTTSPVSSVLSSEPSWLELAQTKGPEIFNKLCLSLFAEMKAYFDHTILLSYNEATQNVLALTWDVDLNESASKLYSLEAPSVLRIVKNTEKPYHGSPVINDFNEKFFEDWHSGDLPDHLTITPLLFEGKIVGMVYASGRNAANTPQALNFAEIQTKEFLKQVLAKLANQAA